MSKAILHVDGDSFFASCEASLNPSLKGRPVVTGQERGIASSMSKEAKALGVTRGMPVFKIKKMFPEVIVLSSDYGTYELFAQRMYSIVRRYSDEVEEYSIDECFAYLPSWDEKVVKKIKKELQDELSMTFSLGLASTKVLAKLASSKNKPDGCTVLGNASVREYISDVDVGKIWGIGPATAREMREQGIKTALDFAEKDEKWITKNFNKNVLEIWNEINGRSVFPIQTIGERPKSIQATRTFTPPSKEKNSCSPSCQRIARTHFLDYEKKICWQKK